MGGRTPSEDYLNLQGDVRGGLNDGDAGGPDQACYAGSEYSFSIFEGRSLLQNIVVNVALTLCSSTINN